MDSLEVRTHSTLTVQNMVCRPVKLPGLSRNGPQGRLVCINFPFKRLRTLLKHWKTFLLNSQIPEKLITFELLDLKALSSKDVSYLQNLTAFTGVPKKLWLNEISLSPQGRLNIRTTCCFTETLTRAIMALARGLLLVIIFESRARPLVSPDISV